MTKSKKGLLFLFIFLAWINIGHAVALGFDHCLYYGEFLPPIWAESSSDLRAHQLQNEHLNFQEFRESRRALSFFLAVIWPLFVLIFLASWILQLAHWAVIMGIGVADSFWLFELFQYLIMGAWAY